MAAIKKLLDVTKLFNLDWNANCRICQINPRVTPYVLCKLCHKDLPWYRQYTDFELDNIKLSVYAAYQYQWPIDRLIHLYKYQYQTDWLTTLLHAQYFIYKPKVDALVAVPLSMNRLGERGFNQSLLIAKTLSKHWNIPLWNGIERIKTTHTQHGLNRAQRLKNLTGAFAVTNNVQIPQSLCLIDDVLTTGSTMLEIANTIQQASPTTQIQGFALAYKPAPK